MFGLMFINKPNIKLKVHFVDIKLIKFIIIIICTINNRL